MSSSSSQLVPPPPPPPSVLPPIVTSADTMKVLNDMANSAEDEVKQTVQRLPSWRLQSPDEPRIQWLACNQRIKHISQQGPTCGLVALCMAASMLNKTEKSLDVVLKSAREKGYTLQGEMFSASNTLKFAEEEFDMTGSLLSDGLHTHTGDIISHLAKGLPVLVPYDKDSNNEPATKKGHSAHWAILTGFLIALPGNVGVPPCCHHDISSPNLNHLPPPWSHDAISTLPHLLGNASLVFVFARQGKSRLLGAWKFDTLATSNQNLTEYDPKLEGEYVFQQEGLATGLANKVILLQRKGTGSGDAS